MKPKKSKAYHSLCLRFPFVLCTIWLAMPPATSKKQEDSLVLISGNVTIAALMEVNEAVDDTCSDYDVQSLQEVMAVSWLVDSLNEMNYIPGINIGKYTTSIHCSSSFCCRFRVFVFILYCRIRSDSCCCHRRLCRCCWQ